MVDNPNFIQRVSLAAQCYYETISLNNCIFYFHVFVMSYNQINNYTSNLYL